MNQSADAILTLLFAVTVYCLFNGGFGYYIAIQKNRSAWESLCFSLLLGPFGLIILACLPTLEPKRRAAPGYAGVDHSERPDEKAKAVRANQVDRWAKNTLKEFPEEPPANQQAPRPSDELAAIETERIAKRYSDQEWAKRSPKDVPRH